MPDWTVGAASTSDADADVDVDVDARLARSRNSGSTERRALDTSLVAAFDGEFDDSSGARMREVGDGRNFTRDFAREVVCDGSVAELEAPVGDLEASVGDLRCTDGSRAFVLLAREGSACDATCASAEDGAGLVLGGAESEDFIEVTERHARSATWIAAIEVRADRGADRHREPPKIGIPAECPRKMRAAVGAFPSESLGKRFVLIDCRPTRRPSGPPPRPCWRPCWCVLHDGRTAFRAVGTDVA